jgi:hypothetical protein
MSTLFAGVRKSDVALAVLLTALGVAMMVENISSTDSSVRVDSRSWLMVPVFAAATVPILWRRRSLLAVHAVTVVALVVHLVAFGWVVRCGAALPLAFALAYADGRLSSRWQSVAGLVATLGIQALVLAQDSAAGLAVLPVTAVIGGAFWGTGAWLRRRSTTAAPGTPERATVESYS